MDLYHNPEQDCLASTGRHQEDREVLAHYQRDCGKIEDFHPLTCIKLK
jgi:hypothetical protein